jgi:hypothetical protein
MSTRSPGRREASLIALRSASEQTGAIAFAEVVRQHRRPEVLERETAGIRFRTVDVAVLGTQIEQERKARAEPLEHAGDRVIGIDPLVTATKGCP